MKSKAKPEPDAFVATFPPPLQELINALRALVKETLPETTEYVNVGWGLLGYRVGVGKRTAYWGAIFADGDHAHLGFEYGILLNDPKHLLEGKGTQVRYVTIKSPRAIRKREFARFIREASDLATLKDKRAMLKLEQARLRQMGKPK